MEAIFIMNRLKIMLRDKEFLKKAATITIPIAIQGLLNTTINFVDTLMIGKLGETTISAVGLSNKVFFVFSLIVFGICSGSGILTAQYWGNKDVKNIKKVLGLTVLLSFFVSILFVIPSIFFPESVMRIFTTGSDTIKIGATYLIIAALSYPFTAITSSYIALLRGVNQVKVPVIISTISIIVNVTFNYILIYGKFGAPALGVAGAAIATLIARIVECLALLIIVYKNNGPIAAKINEMFHFNKEFLRKYSITVFPVILNEFMWGLGVTIYALAYGRLGDAAMAAITITQITEQILSVMTMSISNAAAIILGNELGAGRIKEADEHAKNLILIQVFLTVIIGVLCFISRDLVISLFDVSSEVEVYIRKCFLVFIMYLPFKMFNTINIVGILRSGGDTKACLLIDCTGVWLIGIPMAFIGGLLLKQPIYIVYAMVLIEELYKFVFGVIRYRKKIWLRNIVSAE
jgi:putative MATE family efflux protein